MAADFAFRERRVGAAYAIFRRSARGMDGVAAKATASAAADRAGASDAGERATAATDRIGSFTARRGRTARSGDRRRENPAGIKHAVVVAQLPEEVAVDDLTDIALAAGERATRAAARRLRRQSEPAFSDQT
jgi:hypothetical protein